MAGTQRTLDEVAGSTTNEETESRQCPNCGDELTVTSDWQADDPERTWQRIIRYMCSGCGRPGVETIALDRPTSFSGVLAERAEQEEA